MQGYASKDFRRPLLKLLVASKAQASVLHAYDNLVVKINLYIIKQLVDL